MDRSRSPISENTIRRTIEEEYLDDSFVSDVSDINDDSDSLIFDDDTDLDPNYDPEDDLQIPTLSRPILIQPQPSTSRISSESSDDEVSDPAPRPRPRGRPRTVPNLSDSGSSDGNSDDGTGWTNVTEETDIPHIHNFTFAELSGPKHCPPRNSSPVSYFMLFFTHNLLDTFVRSTNKYAEKFITDNRPRLKEHSRSKLWRPVTRLEILAFLTVIINMGLNPKPTIYMYWTRTSSQFTPWFTRMFNRNRFQAILQFFHVTDSTNLPKPGQIGYDPCARFQPLIDHFNSVSKFHFTPDKNIAIDESMVSTKGHSQLLQYMPKKRHRWGVKLWSLCDSVSHYCLSFFVYKGARDEETKRQIKENGLGYYVVNRLLHMTNLLNKGYHIFIDNFFTSLKLAKYLYSKLTFLTGTLRKKRKGIPDIMKPKFKVGDTKYCRKDAMLLLGYREKVSQKHQVLLLTTDGKAENERRSKSRGTTVRVTSKPKVIRNYNDNMGGVDGSDQMLYQYLDDRKNLKSWKKVTLNIIGRMVLNSFLLYKMNTDKPLSRLDYTISVIEDLSKDWLSMQERRPNISDLADITPTRVSRAGGGDADRSNPQIEKIPDGREKNCCVCSKESTQKGGKRKKSTFMCTTCKKGLHNKCVRKHQC